jgi:hypothetical protein
VKIGSYLRVGFNTTLNIILYAATTGKYLWLEGRVRRGIFRNWARRFRYAPITYAEPSSEQEIVEIKGEPFVHASDVASQLPHR